MHLHKTSSVCFYMTPHPTDRHHQGVRTQPPLMYLGNRPTDQTPLLGTRNAFGLINMVLNVTMHVMEL